MPCAHDMLGQVWRLGPSSQSLDKAVTRGLICTSEWLLEHSDRSINDTFPSQESVTTFILWTHLICFDASKAAPPLGPWRRNTHRGSALSPPSEAGCVVQIPIFPLSAYWWKMMQSIILNNKKLSNMDLCLYAGISLILSELASSSAGSREATAILEHS